MAHWVAHDTQCVSYALSAAPEGPFHDASRQPLVSQTRLGGSIDPDYARDSAGHLYLLWKNDGNCCRLRTHIFSQRLDASGTRLLGHPAILETNDARWEGALVEAPPLWRRGSQYTLFYSANAFNTPAYAVGPGHQALIVDAAGQTWIAYHAWTPAAVGARPGRPGRQLWLDRVDWRGNTPIVHGPTCAAQPAPTMR